MDFLELGKALRSIQEDLGKPDIPSYWIEFMFIIAAAGAEGVTTKEAAEKLGMKQSVASRMVKLMSEYWDDKNKRFAGERIFETKPDLVHRHRQRVFLSERGKEIMNKVGHLGALNQRS